jgi:HSP20 family protein
MYLTRRNPSFSLPSFQGLQREMNRLFDQASGDLDQGLNHRTWAPPVEIFDRGDELVIVAELPGLARKEIDISFDNGQLTLSGQRTAEEEGRNYHRNERSYGRFERSFQLPASYDANKIKAELRNGILTVTLPKKEEAKPRQIPISAG